MLQKAGDHNFLTNVGKDRIAVNHWHQRRIVPLPSVYWDDARSMAYTSSGHELRLFGRILAIP